MAKDFNEFIKNTDSVKIGEEIFCDDEEKILTFNNDRARKAGFFLELTDEEKNIYTTADYKLIDDTATENEAKEEKKDTFKIIKYDSKIIYQFAKRLYDRADMFVFNYTSLGILLGLILGIVIGKLCDAVGVAIITGAVIFGIIGKSIGSEMAFFCKLTAQLTLCLVKVEENTKKKR